MTWRTRPYRDDDVAPVAALLASLGDDSFHSRLGGELHAYYRWKYGDGSAERVRLAAGRDGLVGVVALLERRVQLRGHVVTAYEMGDISTCARHRRQGVFSTLGREACAAAAHGAFTYVKPNAESAPVLQRSLGFAPLVDMQTLARPLRLSSILARRLGRPRLAAWLRPLDALVAVRSPRGAVTVERNAALSSELDAFWDAVAADYPAIVVRDRAYLQWRYADNPTPYVVLTARDARGRLRGYAVALVTRWGPTRVGYLADILARHEGQDETLAALIDGALRVCAEDGARAVHTWVVAGRGGVQAPLRRALRTRGFFGRGRAPVLWRPTREGLRHGPRDWYLTMADFDGI